MERDWLGETHDYFKRWFLREACGAALHDLKVFPMSTSGLAAGDLATYLAILGLEASALATEAPVPDRRPRASYWKGAADPSADYFVDPNTGLRNGLRPSGKRTCDYFFDDDAEALLGEESGQLLVVFDKSIGHGAEARDVTAKLTVLQQRFLAFGYCAQSALIVLARPAGRERIANLFDELQKNPCLRPGRLVRNFE